MGAAGAVAAAQRPEVGRPTADHRRSIDGILWKECTGAPWRDVPGRSGPWSTLASRLRRWRRAGVWDRVFAVVQRRADTAPVRLDDATVVSTMCHP
jgi:transposase